jgi:hypothetical protein
MFKVPGIESISSGRPFSNHAFIMAHALFVVLVPPFARKFPQIADSWKTPRAILH